VLQEIDWQTLAAAVATFIVTAFLALRGWLDKAKETKRPMDVQMATIQDNMTLRENTVHVAELSDDIKALTEVVRANNAALTRMVDLMLIRGDRPGPTYP